MVYTKNMGVVRIFVAVFDVDGIPDSTDIVVDDGVYKIFFTVDKIFLDGKRKDYNSRNMADEDPSKEEEDRAEEKESTKPRNDESEKESPPADKAQEDTISSGILEEVMYETADNEAAVDDAHVDTEMMIQ